MCNITGFSSNNKVCCTKNILFYAIQSNYCTKTNSKGDHQAIMYKKKCSTLIIIREMQIKTTMRYHLTPMRMVIIKSLQIINTGEGVEKRETSSTVGWNVN